jgi:hypothetical protein
MLGEVIRISDRDLRDLANEAVRLLSKLLEGVDVLPVVLI